MLVIPFHSYMYNVLTKLSRSLLLIINPMPERVLLYTNVLAFYYTVSTYCKVLYRTVS